MYLRRVEDTQPLNALLTITLGGDTLSYSCEAVSLVHRKMDSELRVGCIWTARAFS